jgi:hypothetical protein
MKIRTLILLLFLTSLPASNAFGWGDEGHDVVVRLAFRLMKPTERKAAYDLLGTHDTYQIGNWADDIKKKNGTANWHYVDIPDRDEHYNADRDCPNGDCIVAKLAMVQSTIRNHSASRKARKEALLYWFHLVADLYQPFHCYGDKEGGNGITVYFKGEETNLHALWDTKIIRYKNSSPTTLAEDIFNASHRVPAAMTTFIEAAEHSHARAVDMKLKNKSTVNGDYVARSWAMINTCLWDAACMAATIGPDL